MNSCYQEWPEVLVAAETWVAGRDPGSGLLMLRRVAVQEGRTSALHCKLADLDPYSLWFQ